jgi:hypothetical protein
MLFRYWCKRKNQYRWWYSLITSKNDHLDLFFHQILCPFVEHFVNYLKIFEKGSKDKNQLQEHLYYDVSKTTHFRSHLLDPCVEEYQKDKVEGQVW